MQQFLLFCTMLIVASEAFSNKFHSSQSSTRVSRKFSRFAPRHDYPDPDYPMAEKFDPPMFSHKVREEANAAAFVSPLRRRGFRRFGKNSFSSRKNNFNSRQGLRKKFYCRKKRHSSQFFENSRLPPLSSVFGDVSSVRHPNQYILSVYPVYNDKQFRSNKRTFRSLKESGFPVLNRQYLTPKSTEKRSTNCTCDTVTEGTSEDNNQTTAAPNTDDLYDGADKDDPKNFGSSDVTTQSPQDFMSDVPFSNLYSRYLDPIRPSVPLPKIDFKYPYDPEVFDASLRSEGTYTPPFKEKEEVELEEDSDTSQPDFHKLRSMLEEVETILKDEESNFSKNHPPKEKNSKDKENGMKKKKKKKKKKSKPKSKFGQKPVSTETPVVSHRNLKEKIDSVVIPLLKQISEELGKISRAPDTKETSSPLRSKSMKSRTKVSKKASERCIADGTWTSLSFGIEMTFATLPNMMLKVNVTNKRIPVNSKVNSRWSIRGLTLSKQGGPLMLAALYPQKRQIASFVGACKTLSNEDMIFGSWTIFTWMRKFTDLWRAVETKLDILKKKKASRKE